MTLQKLSQDGKSVWHFRGWSEQRAQDYFVWASQVIKGLKGTNAKLEDKLDEVLATKGVKVSS